MKSIHLLVCFFASAMGNDETCKANGAESCSSPDEEVNLMQVRTQVHTHGERHSHTQSRITGKRHTYRGKARPALEYYMHWSRGKVQSHMKRYIRKPDPDSTHLALGQQRMVTTESVVEFLYVHRQRKCPVSASAFRKENYTLLASSVDEKGAEHFVLRSSHGKFQYIAKHLHHILSAYPDVCPSDALTQIKTYKHHKPCDNGTVYKKVGKILVPVNGSDTVEADEVKDMDKFEDDMKDKGGWKGNNSDLSADMGKKGGAPKNLDAQTDPLVMDCKDLFHRTAKEKCGTDFALKVMNAVEKIIDGIGITMQVAVKKGNKTQIHDVDCEFEVPNDFEVHGEFLQSKGDDDDDPDMKNESADDAKIKTEAADGHGPSLEDTTDEEDMGLVATLSMEINLCKCDTASTTSKADIEFFQKRKPSGELSRYKGFEHVNDDIPDVTQAVLLQFGKDVKDDIDLRTEYPNCYADSYKEPVRDQGTCGSCWAFASATAAMNNLCGSASQDTINQAMASSDDRYEVSVQQILSCNAEKVGCDGGYATAANSAFTSCGITREKTSPYKCGGGDPLDHFDKSSGTCDKHPWGGSCENGEKKDAGFNWGGAACVSGEAAMMVILSNGWALYATFDTYANFMTLKANEIYKGTTGDKKGGHALAIVAYGADDGTKYWVLQNSWGTSWALNGYGKMLRGANLCGIEDKAYYMRAWVTEAKRIPPCMEWDSGLIDGSGNGIPCKDIKGGSFGNLCESASWGPKMKAACPNTCDSCMGGASGAVSPSPAAAAPAPSPPPPPPPPDTCDDSTTYTDEYFNEACTFWDGYVCSGMSFSETLEANCPFSCKFCAVKGGPISCTDDKDYVDPNWGMTCEQWYPYSCEGYSFTPALKEACQIGCGLCKAGGSR